ncbi:MAG: T9SS type A sorting domain-containing protein [Bacteroidota bacterium]
MKPISYFINLTLLLGTINSFSQTYFNRTYYLPSVDSTNRTEGFGPIIEIPSAGYLGVYQSWNFNNGDTRLSLCKTNYSGDVITYKAFYDSLWFPTPGTLAFSLDSNFILGCSLSSYADDTTRFYLMKLNRNCDSLWSKKYSSGLTKTTHRKTCITKDGGYILCGWTGASNNQLPTYGYVIKTDSSGNILWNKSYGDSSKFNVATCVLELENGDYFVLLWTSGLNIYERDILLIKTDSLGNEIWEQTYGTAGMFDYGEWITNSNDHNFLISGSQGVALGTTYGWILKIDSLGSIIFSRNYGFSEYSEFNKLIELSNGDLAICGFTQLTNPNRTFGLLYKCDSFGDSLWSFTYSYDTLLQTSNTGRYIWDMIRSSDGGYLLAGQTSPGASGTQDAWLIKVDSLGCTYSGCTNTGLDENFSWSPEEDLTISPNPVLIYTTIKVPLRTYNQTCNIKLMDISNREIYSENFFPSIRQSSFNLKMNAFNPGIYFVIISSVGLKYSAKIVKL